MFLCLIMYLFRFWFLEFLSIKDDIFEHLDFSQHLWSIILWRQVPSTNINFLNKNQLTCFNSN